MSTPALVLPGVVFPRLTEWLLSFARSKLLGTNPRDADLQLVREVTDGLPGAEERLLRLLLPHVRAVANAIVGRGSEVDDAVQVATLQILDDLRGYRGDARLVRWARTVAARVCLRLRAKRRRWLRNAELAQPSQAHTRTPEYDLPRDVQALLEQLPAQQREAVVLRHVLGYTVAEVAELTDAAHDTVKSRLLFGRRALRALLSSEAEERGLVR
ncbi:MAG: RNA polymerase sigma factor [Nannocystales bacterium]